MIEALWTFARMNLNPSTTLNLCSLTASSVKQPEWKNKWVLVALPLWGIPPDNCPSCGVSLSKRPRARSLCPKCRETIFVSMRPLDRKRVLVTFDQREVIDSEWAQAL